MALVNCPDCSKEVSDKAGKCPNCGCPIVLTKEENNINDMQDMYSAVNAFVSKDQTKIKLDEKEYVSIGRLVTGIIFIVLSVIIFLQSCAVGLANVVDGADGIDGTLGLLTFIVLLSVGIISISTIKSKNYKLPFTLATILIIYGFLISYVYKGRYGDLKIWGWVMMICSFVYLLNFKKLRDNKRQ